MSGTGWATESRALVRISTPMIVSQLATVGMGTMDTIMVGPLGAESLAALGLSASLHWALLVIATGTLFGMSPLVSQAFGAGDEIRCRRVFVQGLWIALLLAIPMFAFNLAGEPIALALRQDPAIAKIVGGYMGALAWSVPAILLYFGARQYLEGMGITRPAMVISFGGLALNFAGNLALIYGVPGWVEPMGAVGSGWATALARWFMLIAILGYVQIRFRPFAGSSLRPEARLIRRILQIGVPTGIQASLEIGLFSFAAVMMGWLGAASLAAHQVTINIASITFMVAFGFSLAGAVRVGHQIGAGNPSGTRRSVTVTFALSTGAMAIFALLMVFLPRHLLGLYSSDPRILELGASLLIMAALFQVFDGATAAGFGVLRGAADTRVPMLIAALGYWGVGAPAAYLLGFPLGFGAIGIWGGLVLGLVAVTALVLWRVRTIHWTRPPPLRA